MSWRASGETCGVSLPSTTLVRASASLRAMVLIGRVFAQVVLRTRAQHDILPRWCRPRRRGPGVLPAHNVGTRVGPGSARRRLLPALFAAAPGLRGRWGRTGRGHSPGRRLVTANWRNQLRRPWWYRDHGLSFADRLLVLPGGGAGRAKSGGVHSGGVLRVWRGSQTLRYSRRPGAGSWLSTWAQT